MVNFSERRSQVERTFCSAVVCREYGFMRQRLRTGVDYIRGAFEYPDGMRQKFIETLIFFSDSELSHIIRICTI